MTDRVHRTMVQALATGLGCGLAAAGTTHMAYGWPLFAGLPLLTGFLAVALDRRPRLVLSLLPMAVMSLALLAWKIEGIVCLAMAAPLAIPLALLGGYLALVTRRRAAQRAIGSCLILLVPWGVLTAPRGPHPVEFHVSTEIVVNAPPEVVWKYVYAFPDLAAPTEWIFRAGVAAPMGSSMEELGPGAERSCKLSTGVMRERITVWDPPRLLRFAVLWTPPAMKEMSPYRDLNPPHLNGFYMGRQGEFRLTALPGGRTLLTGTSWYSHGLEPAEYWRWWSDYIVHKVHQRVLEHIRQLAERSRSEPLYAMRY